MLMNYIENENMDSEEAVKEILSMNKICREYGVCTAEQLRPLLCVEKV